MTNEEAKQWIEWIKRKYIHGGDEEFDYKRKIALDMAIKALEQEPKTGRWIDSSSFLMVVIGDTVVNLPAKECSICHKPHIKGYGADFCPNCGAKMQEVANDDKI